MPESQAGLPRLLVVEDDPKFCDFAARVGELAGYAVTPLTDPRRLLACIEEQPDVILLDLMMPEVDGVEVMRILAASGTRARIVLISGVGQKVLESASLLGQAHGLTIGGHVRKPVHGDDLRSLLAGQRTKLASGNAGGAPGPSLKPKFTTQEIEHAITARQIFVHYQPQVSLKDGRWTGIEALVRWNHPRLGHVPPGLFITQAERAGLGLMLTYAVLEIALSECKAVAEELRFDGTLSVNLPATALSDVEFPEGVQERIQRLGCEGMRVSFEVTESSVSWDSSIALDILTRLRMRQYGVAVDDFGTGHSSLDRLHRFPFDELKIDMSFVREAATNLEARAITENSIELARRLDMATVAEGVESASAWEWLQRAGCDVAQGYFVSRPIPAEGLFGWRSRWHPPN